MKIVSAAVRFQSNDDAHWQIMTGHRHCDVYKKMYELGIYYNKKTHVDGFLTESFQFLDRHEAVAYAKVANQIPETFSRTELFSEDLW